ncbi:MAG: tetraacyldisaccharide 4'-kinase [Bdellovibrionales bacterium]
MIFLRYLLSPFALLFQFGVIVRQILFDLKILKSVRTKAKVFSVGNITSGGTGKTPIVSLVGQWAERKKITTAIIARGYGTKVEGCQEVSLSPSAAEAFGDEPVEIKSRLPLMPVFVSASKSQAALHVDQTLSPKLMIVDDGFQHLRLERDLDIVLLDTTAPDFHYWPLPMGYGRDTFVRLQKADVVILTKFNLATEVRQIWHKTRVPKNKPIFYADYLLEEITDLQTGKRIPISQLIQKKVVLMAGLANPLSFENLLCSEKMNIMEYFQFPDHHAYSKKDLEKVYKYIHSTNANCIITTEKDAVKLAPFIPFPVPILVTKLKLSFQNEKEFYEILDRHMS